MTVATTQISEVWTGDASSVTFPIPFPFLDRAHLIVWKETAGGVQTAVTIQTATGEGDPSGGSITLTEPVGAGFTLHVRRNTPKTQETDYVPHDPFPADSHERALDKLTMIVQELIASGSIDLDIDHLGDLIGDSPTIVWTRSPDGTKLIGSVVPGDWDTYKVKVNASDATPGFLEAKLADTTDTQFSPTEDGEQLDNIVYQLTGLGARLINIQTSFSWDGWSYGASLGGRGVSPGYAFVGGVRTKVWCANDGVATLYWTTDEWKTVTKDTSLFGIVGPVGLNWHPPCLKYLNIAGVPSWVATSNGSGAWYYAQDVVGNYNPDGTLKQSAWVAGTPCPAVIADIGSSSIASCVVGNHHLIHRTTDWVTFTQVFANPGSRVLGGIDTDRMGRWIAVGRDDGILRMSSDDGVTWVTPQVYVRHSEDEGYLPSASLMNTGSVCCGNGVWLITGASGYAYSYDGIHWTIQNNPLGTFYGVGFDGVKFYAVNPQNAGSPSPVVYQLLVSQIPAHRQIVAEKGLVVSNGMWLPDLPNAESLGTNELGAVVAKSSGQPYFTYSGAKILLGCVDSLNNRNSVLATKDGVNWVGFRGYDGKPNRMFRDADHLYVECFQSIYALGADLAPTKLIATASSASSKGPVLDCGDGVFLLLVHGYDHTRMTESESVAIQDTNPQQYARGVAHGQYVWECASNGYHRSSSNRGSTWSSPFAPGYGMMAGWFVNGMWCLMDGAKRIFTTSDVVPVSSSKWTQRGTFSSYSGDSGQVSASDGNLKAAVGHSTYGIVYTVDGVNYVHNNSLAGETVELHYYDGYFYRLSTTSSVAYIHRTTDFVNWQLVASKSGVNPYCMIVLDTP